MKKNIYLIFICLFFSCKTDAELAMERGIQMFDWGKYSQAILEFNEAKFLQSSGSKQTYDDLKLLAHTHYNLAITHAKLNNLSKAYQEAQRAFALIPKEEYKELLDLIVSQKEQN
tara:strand:- start:819 stop:1163 length:345 start_codon:yes stop_codon:yes gene_type:complete